MHNLHVRNNLPISYDVTHMQCNILFMPLCLLDGLCCIPPQNSIDKGLTMATICSHPCL